MISESVTVVIPTIGAGIHRTVEALDRQTDPGIPWSVLVIDNGLSQPDRDALAVRVVREDRRGAAPARNRGISEVTSSLIAFLDDDVVPDPDWLKLIVEPIVGGRCTATGGPVVLGETAALPRWFGGHIGALYSEFEGGDYVLTANAAFRTTDVRAVGGFVSELGPRPGSQLVNDDVSLCQRLEAAGGVIEFVAGARVVHEVLADRLNLRFLLHRAYAQGRSDWILDSESADANRAFVGGAPRRTWHRLRHEPLAFPVRLASAAAELARAAGYAIESTRRKPGTPLTRADL